MRKSIRAIAQTILVMTMIFLSPASALPAGSQERGASGLPGLHVHAFQPKAMDTGLKLHVQVPDMPAPEGGFPVLYAFDADLSFPALANMARMVSAPARRAKLTPAVVVGIGYDDPSNFNKRRTYDMTPADSDYVLPPRPNGLPWPKVGGGDAFRDVLIDEIKPFISERYPVDTGAETLAGHSLGGLLTLHVLVTRPDAFERYVAASPSLWFNGRKTMSALIALQERTAPSPGNRIPLRLTVGSQEETLSSWSLASDMTREDREAWLQHNRMVGNAGDLASALTETDGVIEVSFEIYSGLEHMPASLPAFYHALQFAIDPGVFD